MKLYRDLDEREEKEFRAWARRTYKPFTPIDGVWHPVVQHECMLINMETDIALDAGIGLAPRKGANQCH